ncbi:hypothetical protein [Dethiobacter alkaliphilus]|uniref:hypothetical protein n=1 Tax=Dethiobacter alkaliphilus TaxID=427926 RepID=UPI002227BAC0|nr:hypothetical protein [Dethiobacter alkaliphilus]MCW3489267.1 hypothetical protein [Dethiobacter alkaliphilus]
MTLETIILFLDKYNLPWLLWALTSWLVIYMTCNRQQLRHAFSVGLWTAAVGLVLEHFFIVNKFWTERFIMLPVGELDLFVVIGPFFTLGVMLIRYLPGHFRGQMLAVFAWSATATAGELLSLRLGFLQYHPDKWTILHSFVGYYLGLMSALGFYFSRQKKC